MVGQSIFSLLILCVINKVTSVSLCVQWYTPWMGVYGGGRLQCCCEVGVCLISFVFPHHFVMINYTLDWACIYLKLNLCSVRVSNELGAGHPKSAAFSVVVSTGTSMVISVVFAIVTFILRHKVSYAFTEGKTVSDAVADLTPLLALAIILNGIQPVLSGKFNHLFILLSIII